MTPPKEPIGICKDMGGAKCAGEYCDFWDREEQACSTAVESKLRVEVLRATLARTRDTTPDKESAENLQEMLRHKNVVAGTQTKQ